MAPVIVFMHYLISINSNGTTTNTLDVSKYENFVNNEGIKLETFIDQTLAKTGDISYVTMKEIMKLDDLDIEAVVGFQKKRRYDVEKTCQISSYYMLFHCLQSVSE